MFDLNTLDFSGTMPVICTRALRGKGSEGMDARLFFESARKARSFSIFLGRGSFDVRRSRARLASVSTSSPWRRMRSRRSSPLS